MRARQRGITFIGWIFLLIPLAIVGYALIRTVPVYLNYMKVAKVMEQIAAETKGDEQISLQALRNSLDRRFDIDSVTYPKSDQISFVRDGQKWVAETHYEDVTPLFANVSILLRFDKRVELN
jgi:hypothetical protein